MSIREMAESAILPGAVKIISRRNVLAAPDSDDDSESDHDSDDDVFSGGNTVQSKIPKRTRRRSSVVAREKSIPRQRRQSLFGSKPLSNLATDNAPKADIQKYRRGSVLADSDSTTSPSTNTTNTTNTTNDTYDLTQIPDPTHKNVLNTLSKRWKDGLIYTSVGDCLISVNPYRWIEALYNPKVIEGCLGNVSGGEHFPHVYQIANDAYHALKMGKGPQSIVIAGESGSGKTENMKKCLQFFTRIALGDNNNTSNNSSNNTDDDDDTLECRILAMNPILEALGNAKTSRNDNSSRFGRWIEINFTRVRSTSKSSKSSTGGGDDSAPSPRVVGCTCQSYLLEKSRVTQQQPGDRNFHIFYMLLIGCTSKQKEKYHLSGGVESFNYVKRKDNAVQGGGNDAKQLAKENNEDLDRFTEFMEAATNVGLKELEIDNVLKMVSACLHLGNVHFEEVDTGSCQVSTEGRDALAISSDLLNINSDALSTSICYRTIQMRSSGEEMQVPMGKEKAEAARDALAKSCYSRLFTWMVARLNETLIIQEDGTKNTSASSVSTASAAMETVSAGILDIFGFEIFHRNEFEQLCINYVNEKLQHFFNKYTFDEETKLYEREGVPLQPIEFSQNVNVLQLFEKRAVGILALLDEELIRPTGNDKSFCRKISSKNGQHPRFEKSRFGDLEFTVRHFAGDVLYSADGFLDKNRDRLQENLLTCIQTSTNNFITEILFKPKSEKKENEMKGSPLNKKSKMKGGRHTIASSRGGRRPTSRANRVSSSIVSQLRISISSLLKRLEETTPHFIRCIKPNYLKSTNEFNDKLVLHQLKCLGVLEAIQIQQRGYPVRYTHQEFITRYRICGLDTGMSTQIAVHVDKKEYLKACECLKNGLTKTVDPRLSEIVIGKTMIFFRPIQRFVLENIRTSGRNKFAVMLQCALRLKHAKSKAKLHVKIRQDLRNILARVGGESINEQNNKEKKENDDGDEDEDEEETKEEEDSTKSLTLALRDAIQQSNQIARCKWPELLEAKEILHLLEKREAVAKELEEHLHLWGVNISKGNPSTFGRASDFRADDYLPRLQQCVEDASSIEFGGRGSEERMLVEAARSVLDAATERSRAKHIIREALAGSTRSVLLNALEAVRSVVNRYGEGFIESDVRRIHTMLLHIEQEKQHVSSLRKALASSGIRGAVGRLNTSHINFTELQTAIKRCSHSSLKTVQARSLLRVAKGLYDVRYAVSQNDWNSCYTSFNHLRTTIESITSLVNGRMDIIGIPPSAAGEIEILTEEVKERQFCTAIEKELLLGRIFGAAGALNFSGARKSGLKDALSRAHALVASPRGTAMQSLAQCLLDIRTSASLSEWNVVTDILPVARVRVFNFNAVMENRNTHSKHSSKESIVHNAKLTITTVTENDTSSSSSNSGSVALHEVSLELDVLQSQLEYVNNTNTLKVALNSNQIMSCDDDLLAIDVSLLDAAIMKGQSCGYESLPFHHLLDACRLTRNLRAGLRAMDVKNIQMNLKSSLQFEHRNCLSTSGQDELHVIRMIVDCEQLEKEAKYELSKGSATLMEIGKVDVNTIDTTGLTSVVQKGTRLDRTTYSMESTLWSAQHVLQLRTSFKHSNWKEARISIDAMHKGKDSMRLLERTNKNTHHMAMNMNNIHHMTTSATEAALRDALSQSPVVRKNIKDLDKNSNSNKTLSASAEYRNTTAGRTQQKVTNLMSGRTPERATESKRRRQVTPYVLPTECQKEIEQCTMALINIELMHDLQEGLKRGSLDRSDSLSNNNSSKNNSSNMSGSSGISDVNANRRNSSSSNRLGVEELQYTGNSSSGSSSRPSSIRLSSSSLNNSVNTNNTTTTSNSPMSNASNTSNTSNTTNTTNRFRIAATKAAAVSNRIAHRDSDDSILEHALLCSLKFPFTYKCTELLEIERIATFVVQMRKSIRHSEYGTCEKLIAQIFDQKSSSNSNNSSNSSNMGSTSSSTSSTTSNNSNTRSKNVSNNNMLGKLRRRRKKTNATTTSRNATSTTTVTNTGVVMAKKGKPLKVLLKNNERYPLIYQEMRYVQDLILQQYVTEQLTEHAVGTVHFTTPANNSTKNGRDITSSGGGGGGGGGGTQATRGMRLSVGRGRDGNMECTWNCTWSGANANSNSTSNYRYNRSSGGSDVGDLSRLQAAISLSETVEGTGNGNNGNNGNNGTNGTNGNNVGSSKLKSAAVLMYGLRRSMRDGDEKGIHLQLSLFEKFIPTEMSSDANIAMVPVWWPPMLLEVQCAKSGMEAIRLARNLCVGLDTASPSIAVLEKSTANAVLWLNHVNQREATFTKGKRLIERLTSASEKVLELRHALLRGDEIAVANCLSLEVAIEPLVRKEFDQARLQVKVNELIIDLIASVIAPPPATTKLETTLQRSEILLHTETSISNAGNDTDSNDETYVGSNIDRSSRKTHAILHTMATHILALRRSIKMLDVRALGESLHHAEIWASELTTLTTTNNTNNANNTNNTNNTNNANNANSTSIENRNSDRSAIPNEISSVVRSCLIEMRHAREKYRTMRQRNNVSSHSFQLDMESSNASPRAPAASYSPSILRLANNDKHNSSTGSSNGNSNGNNGSSKWNSSFNYSTIDTKRNTDVKMEIDPDPRISILENLYLERSSSTEKMHFPEAVLVDWLAIVSSTKTPLQLYQLLVGNTNRGGIFKLQLVACYVYFIGFVDTFSEDEMLRMVRSSVGSCEIDFSVCIDQRWVDEGKSWRSMKRNKTGRRDFTPSLSDVVGLLERI